jgi:hypothetical protein
MEEYNRSFPYPISSIPFITERANITTKGIKPFVAENYSL